MANFNNATKVFAIQARGGIVARVRINTMSTTGKAGLKAFALEQPGVADMALELGMFSKTVEQLLAAKVNHVMILVSSNTATRFFQAQAAIKAGASSPASCRHDFFVEFRYYWYRGSFARSGGGILRNPRVRLRYHGQQDEHGASLGA